MNEITLLLDDDHYARLLAVVRAHNDRSALWRFRAGLLPHSLDVEEFAAYLVRVCLRVFDDESAIVPGELVDTP